MFPAASRTSGNARDSASSVRCCARRATRIAGRASAVGAAGLDSALAGIETLETPTAHDEAEAIALVLRSTIETPGKTAALITPDRTLARRVAARLKTYDLIIDDSAGVPVARALCLAPSSTSSSAPRTTASPRLSSWRSSSTR
jgi:ATP-dependent helicase/nuclease subunit B